MRRSVVVAFVALALVAAACGDDDTGSTSASEATELNALVWCDHTDPALLAPFEEANNVTVNVKDYDGTGVALGILEQSQPGEWDVFVVDSVDVPRVVEAGLMAELDPADYPWDQFFADVDLPGTHYQNGNLYAVPEKFGYNTIAFNNENVPIEAMRDVESLWDPAYAGRIAVYDYYIPVMEQVAISLGIEPAAITAADLPAIEQRLMDLKPHVSLIGDVVTVQTALATGEVDIIVGGGEFVTGVLTAENPAFDWVLPEQGGIRWQQAIGVMADSNRKELATKFVQYIVSPEGQARLATSSCYWAMPANSQATLTADEKAVLRWDEQPGFVANSDPYFIPDADLDAAMLDVWTRFLQG
ncbi:extracellular solute-binding protein [bacterium]|nr:extracellular solute-binding protein [bacterium]